MTSTSTQPVQITQDERTLAKHGYVRMDGLQCILQPHKDASTITPHLQALGTWRKNSDTEYVVTTAEGRVWVGHNEPTTIPLAVAIRNLCPKGCAAGLRHTRQYFGLVDMKDVLSRMADPAYEPEPWEA